MGHEMVVVGSGTKRLGLGPSRVETESGVVTVGLGRYPVGASTTHVNGGGGGGVGGAVNKRLGRYPVGAATTQAAEQAVKATMRDEGSGVRLV